jgi:hypothetical protein
MIRGLIFLFMYMEKIQLREKNAFFMPYKFFNENYLLLMIVKILYQYYNNSKKNNNRDLNFQ